MHKRQECIDVGSEYCPCYLAKTNNCIICSQLQRNEFCDCNWRGVCIYQDFLMNGSKIKQQRDYYKSKIIDIREIGNDSYVLKFKVSKTLARQLKEPGSYVFLRNEELPQYFDVPMSVMQSDTIDGTITIAFKTVGAKTSSLKKCKEDILVKGPYWNGVYGLKNLKSMKEKTCLVLARGISQAPTLLALEKLVKNKNKVILVLDRGSIGEIFIYDYIDEMEIETYEEDLMSEKGRSLVKQLILKENISLVYSAGSDLLHMNVIKILDELGVDPYLSVTNNNEICCGEGICGGCTVRLRDGTRTKTCKTQVDSRKIIERRVLLD